jgi:hypothetical protein
MLDLLKKFGIFPKKGRPPGRKEKPRWPKDERPRRRKE